MVFYCLNVLGAHVREVERRLGLVAPPGERGIA